MNCEHAREEFSALLDNELSPEVRAAVEAHLAECSNCLRELDQLKRVDLVYRKLEFQRAPAGFEARVRASARENVIRFGRRPFPQRQMRPLLAAAAVLFMLAGAWFVQMRKIDERFNVASVQEKAETGPAAPDAFPVTLQAVPQASAPAPVAESAPVVKEQVVQDSLPAVDVTETKSDKSEATKKETAGGVVSGEAAGGTGETVQPRRFKPKAVDKTETDSALQEQIKALGYLGNEKAKGQTPPAVEEPKPEPEKAMEEKAGESQRPAVSASAPAPEPPRGESAPTAIKLGVPSPPAASAASAPATRLAAKASVEAEETPSLDTEVDKAARSAPAPVPAPAPAVEGLDQAYIANDMAAPSDGVSGQVAPPAPKTMERALPSAAGGVSHVPDSAPKATVKGHRFFLTSDIWCEEGYAGQQTTTLVRDSKELKALIAKNAEIADFLKLGKRIIFSIDEEWYSVSPPQQEKRRN